ncbi:hypothetical protein [Dysgonomonas massiliensis]|uniref:hypothetical protein n=1 Tax=Dysgonomonas massiliensis TaxID=2040292 RepID=UPI000C770B04|nr:hypothetical protein [Dysgonomonas massiliensis]
MQQSGSIDEFKLLLKEKNVEPIFCQNEEGRIYGVSFIDYQNKTILNGSRLGKEFSVNVFHEISTSKNRPPMVTENRIESDSDFITSLFPSFFGQHSTDYDAESFAKGKQREEEIRKRKNKGRGL